MIQEVDAVYEHGIPRPLQPLSLTESEVKLTISTPGTGRSCLDPDRLERARAQVAAMPSVPTIEEIRALLATLR